MTNPSEHRDSSVLRAKLGLIERTPCESASAQRRPTSSSIGTAPEANAIPIPKRTADGFGSCSFTGACAVECPAEISLSTIAEMHAHYFKARVSVLFEGE